MLLNANHRKTECTLCLDKVLETKVFCMFYAICQRQFHVLVSYEFLFVISILQEFAVLTAFFILVLTVFCTFTSIYVLLSKNEVPSETFRSFMNFLQHPFSLHTCLPPTWNLEKQIKLVLKSFWYALHK